MILLASIADRALAAVGLQRSGSVPAPRSGAGAIPADQAAMTTATVAEVRAWLDAHDNGDFQQSARLAELAMREADLVGALTQRLLAPQGYPLCFEAARDKRTDERLRADVEARWPRIVSAGTELDMQLSAAMLGFAVGQVTYAKDDGELWPALEPWPSADVEFRAWERRWYVHTRTGPLAITPGDGQWVLYTPRSSLAPWAWGAIRCTAEWVLRSAYASQDAARHSEVHGIPVWAAYLPSGARETTDGKAYLRSLRTMGRNAAVPLPQGADKSQSYDLKLIAPETDAYRIFEFLLRTAGGKFRLALLGQDLTSQNNRVGTNASSETGREVTHDVISAGCETWAECLREQVLVPLSRYRTGKGELAPWVYRDTKPKPDRQAEATALNTLGDAVPKINAALAAAGSSKAVDVESLATAHTVPLIERPKVEPTPAPTPTTDPAPGGTKPEGDEPTQESK